MYESKVNDTSYAKEIHDHKPRGKMERSIENKRNQEYKYFCVFWAFFNIPDLIVDPALNKCPLNKRLD